VNSGVRVLLIRAKTFNGIEIRMVTRIVTAMILLRLPTAEVLQVTLKIGRLNWANKGYSKLAKITGVFQKAVLSCFTVLALF